MRKSIILVLIASLILGVFLVSCNSEVTSNSSAVDKLVKVTIDGNSKGISATAVADNVEDYYWYYTATKNGGIYVTGQTSGWTPVKNGKGLTGANLGYFSSGSWTFAFRAYVAEPSDYSTGYRYYHHNLAVNLDEDKSLTVTMHSDVLEDAELVFPDTLNWVYVPESNTDAAVTLTTLANRKAYMRVYAKAAGNENATEVLIATSGKADISTDSNGAYATFSGFKNTNNESVVRLASGSYELIFKVFVTASANANPSENDQQVGDAKTTSVTAYFGGKINISRTGECAVDDNESGYHVVVDSVNVELIEAQYDSVNKVSNASIAAAAIPATPDTPGLGETAVEKTQSVATTITTSVTAVTEESKKSTVSIPAAALAESKVSVTNNNNVVTTTTVSSTHTLSMKVVTENVDTSGTSFEIAEGNTPAVGINLDLTKITTTVEEVEGEVTNTETSSAVPVVDFGGKYITIATYIEPNLENVQVGYKGNAEQPVFKGDNKNPSVAIASADASSSNAGTGYNPETGLLVFKTNHFSSFFVTRKADAKIIIGNSEVYYQTLVDAINAINALQTDDEKTIVVMRDLDFSTDVYNSYEWAGSTYNPLEILANSVTLDLGGHTISNMGNCAIAFGHLLAKDGRVSNVKIKNGTLSAGTTDNVRNSYVLLIAGADGARIENVTTTGGINVCSGSTGVVIDSCNLTGTKYYTVCAQTGSHVIIRGTSYSKNTDNTVANKAMFWVQGASIDSDMQTSSNPTGAFDSSTITIQSGLFSVDTTNGGVFYLGSGLAPVVKGGTFNIDPTAYLADGYAASKNDPETGKWTVYEAVASVLMLNVENDWEVLPTKYFNSLQAAIDAVPDNPDNNTNNIHYAYIKLLKDVDNGCGLSTRYSNNDGAAKNIIIDFNGHTYTIVGDGAGSTGTKTQAMHWCKDSNIVLMNGSIVVAENADRIKMAMQNYGSLTMIGMKADFSKIPVLTYGDYSAYPQYAMWSYKPVPSFNGAKGSVIILTGDTDVTVKSGASSCVYDLRICEESSINGSFVFDEDGSQIVVYDVAPMLSEPSNMLGADYVVRQATPSQETEKGYYITLQDNLPGPHTDFIWPMVYESQNYLDEILCYFGLGSWAEEDVCENN